MLNIENVKVVTLRIEHITTEIKNKSLQYTTRRYSDLFNEVIGILKYWVDSEYIVGNEKEPDVREVWNEFFNKLYLFLIECESSNYDTLKRFKNKLYKGHIVRYISVDNLSDIRYDNTYSSWSKNDDMDSYYITKQMHSIILKLSYDITNDYGIDISAFGIGNENEVIYPMIPDVEILQTIIKD